MRMLVCILAASLYVTASSAYLLENEDFDAGDAGWDYSSAWGSYFYPDGPDTIASLGGWGNGEDWSNTSLWQEPGIDYEADTAYTLKVIWRQAPNEPLIGNVRLVFYDVSVATNWIIVGSALYTPGTIGTEWLTSTLVLDTAANPSVVGKPIGISFDLTSGEGTWVHADLISLTADEFAPVISEQPASRTVYTDIACTFAIEGFGAPNPAVQWYAIDSGVTNPVAGATNYSYTTPPATLAMNGTAYFAELSNIAGTVVSDAATISVVTASADANEVFSVQLGDSGVGGWQPLDAAEMTGAFPITNWNAISVDTGAGSWQEQTFPLNDEYGIGGGVDLIVRGAADADNFENPLSGTAAISKLMNSFISTWWRAEAGSNALGEGMMELVLTNLDNAVSYNVYVYLADPVRNDPAAGGREADIDAGGVTNYTGALPVSLPTAFEASANQNPLGPRDAGNYVRLTGITPVSGAITITVNYYDPPWEGWGAGIAGVQVVKESRDAFGPIFNPQPADQSVITNTTAVITAGVLGQPGPITMQWYEIAGGSTNLIPGANSMSYTTPPVTDATSGQGYFMIASTGLNTATSQVAYVTGLHLAYPGLGLLQVDQYFITNSSVANVLDPGWRAANTPSKTYWIDSFENLSQLPDNSTERIYGFFTPRVTTNYVFFISADDDALLLLSTDDDPANVRQIAYEEFWSADGTSWTNSGGGSLPSQKRSDQYTHIPFLPGGSWPTGHTISLTAGVSYYIEVGHRQGGGGQSAAVTYTFAGDPLPADGTPTVMTAEQVSTFSALEDLVPAPVISIGLSGSDLIFHGTSGSNGIAEGRFDIVSADDLFMPIESWTVEETGFLDTFGDMTLTNTPTENFRFYRMRLLP